MASIERTAYPQFRRNTVVKELIRAYTPSDIEAELIRKQVRFPAHALTFAILLKTHQRLGYFPALKDVPYPIVRHIRASLRLRPNIKHTEPDRRSLFRYQRQIRAHLKVRAFAEGGLKFITRVIAEAAKVKDNPADLINVGIEQLLHARFELPGFSTLDRLARRVRHRVNLSYFQAIAERLTASDRQCLDALLVVQVGKKTSPYQDLKRTAKRGSYQQFEQQLAHLHFLEDQVGDDALLDSVPEIKRRHFAAEARALDAAELLDFSDPKRHTLLTCLIHRARVQCRDDLAEMLCKRMTKLHRRAKDELEAQRKALTETADGIVTTMSDVVRVLGAEPDDARAGGEIRRLVGQRGDLAALAEQCEALAATREHNYLALIWRYYQRPHRAVLLRTLEALEWVSTSEDTALIDALKVLKTRSKSDWLSDPVDLSFTTHAWRDLILQHAADGTERVHRRHFEVCVFSALANELRSGDIAVVGSEAFADYREQLLPWSECEPKLAEYCAQVELPDTAEAFVDYLRERLAAMAQEVDRGYRENADMVIDEAGVPVIRRHVARQMSASAKALEVAVLERMRERSVIEILCDVEHWTGWARHFGPLSGSDPKIDQPKVRYVLTAFTYGCNLGPAQAARHLRGACSAHMLSFVNRRHIDASKLSASGRDIINSYDGLSLPKFWGDGGAAAADGTKYELYIQNMTSSYHIRYGGWGGIAYHHVSDTYIALFSHFIPCSVWEAIYIFDGLLKNTSTIQPERIHADTQGQSLPVFGLSCLLGVDPMPRIRNWKDYRFFRPEANARYTHLEGMFHEAVDWDLITRHWKDLMQVVLSIRAGKIVPSTLLRKLGTYSRENRLYLAFKALGTAVRTHFLLRYVSEPDLREAITSSTNKVEAYNGFSKYLFFGGEGVIGENDPIEQEKSIKYNDLIANAVVFHNVVEQTQILRQLMSGGWKVSAADVEVLSPYVTAHIKRFGDYLIDYDARPDPYDGDLQIRK